MGKQAQTLSSGPFDELDRKVGEVSLVLEVLDRLDTILERSCPGYVTDTAQDLEIALVRRIADQFGVELKPD